MERNTLESVIKSVLSEASDPASEKRKQIRSVARPDEPVDTQTRTRQQEIQKKIIDEQEKTEMTNTKRFAELQGISDSLIEAAKKVASGKSEEKMSGGKTKVDVNPSTKDPDVKEELKGGQKKLDKNKNGKLDAHDFKLLRKEETEEVDEARGVAPGAVDKHNCATHVYHEQFGNGKTIYSQHADPDAEGNIAWYDVMFEHGIVRELPINEMKVLASESHERHSKKMKKEEVEELDELDRNQGSMLNRYIRKTTDDPKRQSGRNLALMKKHGDKNYGLPEPKVKAVQREEVEQVDEISDKLKNSYIRKADKQVTGTNAGLVKKDGGLKTKGVSPEDFKRKYDNRKAGIKRAMGEENELDEADVASAQKAAQDKLKSAQITAKATVQADKIKDQARKQAQMNSFEPEGNSLIEAIKKMVREPKYQVTSDSVKGVKSSDAGQTHLSDDYVNEGRKPKEPEEQPRGDEHPFAPRKADNEGKVTFKHKGKEYTDSVSNYQKHRGHYMDAQGAERKNKVLHNYVSSLGK